MKKITIIAILVLFNCTSMLSQTIIIQNQNNQNTNSSPQVVERIVEKEKPVYIHVNPSSQEPIVINGYLKVFPQDLGEFESFPYDIIADINKNRVYGTNTWRIPTEGELKMLIQNAKKLGLKDVCISRGNRPVYDFMYWYKESNGKYVGTYHWVSGIVDGYSPRTVRLVSSGY